MRVGFLGTGGANGVPAFYCGCVACAEAAEHKELCRGRSSLMVQGAENTMIDASPDVRQQLLREGINRVDRLLLTHTHFDHAGGLPELEFYVRLRRGGNPLPAVMTADSAEWVYSTLGYMAECLDITLVQPGDCVTCGGLAFTALEVTHSRGALGFLIEDERHWRVAYLPDTGPLPEPTARAVAAADTLILGATFFGANWMPEDHLSVNEAIAWIQSVGVREGWLTHVSMHYDTPVCSRDLEEYVEKLGDARVHVAHDGLWLERNDYMASYGQKVALQ